MAVFEPDSEAPPKIVKKVMLKKHRDMWWERSDHPMTDGEFIDSFCAHVLTTTKDTSLMSMRNRCYRFIRNFMAPELENQLTKYREDYP